MGDTAACTIPAESGRAERLTATLVRVIERDHLSVAAAARFVGVGVETAGALVRQWAIEREAAEQEAEERLDDIRGCARVRTGGPTPIAS